jgi:hypothetical protein
MQQKYGYTRTTIVQPKTKSGHIFSLLILSRVPSPLAILGEKIACTEVFMWRGCRV